MDHAERSLVDQLLSTKDGRRRFFQERGIRKVGDLIDSLMEERDVSRAQLAELLGRSRGWVTQLLDGEHNKTVRTVADVLAVLGFELEVGAQPIGEGKAERPSVCIEIPGWSSMPLKWPTVPQPETDVALSH